MKLLNTVADDDYTVLAPTLTLGLMRRAQSLPCEAIHTHDKEIHANHVEASNASIRRGHSAYRRKTNTYAKKKSALQRVLDGLWIIHNFIRVHFTTKQVPTVALGILEEGLSWEEALMIQKTA